MTAVKNPFQEIDQKLGKICWGILIIGNSAFGALSTFSIMHVYYAVKYDVGSCNLGMSATKSRGNVGEFTLPGDWLPLM